MWIGAQTGGLNKLNLTNSSFSFYVNSLYDPNYLSNNVIRSICMDKAGILWVGDNNGGLVKINRVTNERRYYQHDPDDPFSISGNIVSAINEEKDGKTMDRN